MFKILDKFGGEVSANEQAIFNKISTNNSSGYVNGYLNSLAIARLASNMISIDSGLLSIQGFRFVNDTLQTYTVSVTPSQPIPFQLVAVFSHYVSSENDTLSIITRPTESLRQENLYGGGNAVYELELARFTMTADGITDFVVTLEQLTYNDQDFTEVLEKVDNAESNSEAALTAANAANSNAKAAVSTANTAKETANTAKTASDTATAKVAELSEQIGEKQGTTVTIGGVAQARIELVNTTQSTKTINYTPYFWKQKTWNKSVAEGANAWTDGGNIYYSSGASHYVLNRETSTWETKTWQGLTSFLGDYIWTDGENIYYSRATDQYVLNRETSTWEPKSWNGLTSFFSDYIWTDGENIYYSRATDQYVLNCETSTWETKTWQGLTSFNGGNTWTDGENIYCSTAASQYVLNKTTSTWVRKTWNGLTSFFGGDIWTDGNDIYHSNNASQYVLNRETSTWETKTWQGLTSFNADRIWTDGNDIYYSGGTEQYALIELIKSTKPILNHQRGRK